MDHSHFMRRAIEVAGQNAVYPFGALLVERASGRIVAEGFNRGQQNPTWHGEIDVINRHAAAGAVPSWAELALYTTAEPCPMCQSAILWSGIPMVIYGTSIERLVALGWKQIEISSPEVTRRAPFAKCEIIGGILADQCDTLFIAALRH